MIRQAFLIIAHNEFSVLQRLITALDDVRVDIYVHIDKKVQILPDLHTKHSGLYMVDNRIDTRWGDVSQIETEFALFKEAFHSGEYAFYHLISGTHFPIKTIDQILSFYEHNREAVILDWFDRDDPYQEVLKVHRFNICTRRYAYGSKCVRRINQMLWRFSSTLQGFLHINRYATVDFYKASNWVSLPEDVLKFLLDNQTRILKRYAWTFCGDEYFVPTELMNSQYRDRIIKSYSILYQLMQSSGPSVLSLPDYDSLITSQCFFARKFSSESIELIDKLEENIFSL